MSTELHDFLSGLLSHLNEIDFVKPEDIPNIDLYMDQVITFMNSALAGSRRHDDDKLLTKTMINNYAKNSLLPAPERKKYSKEHLLALLFIYYFKNIMSISDIHEILNPLFDKYFGNKEGYDFEDIYRAIFLQEEAESQKVLKDLGKKYAGSADTFSDFPEEDQEYLHKFAFICTLAFDVYIKKMLIEHLVDEMSGDNNINTDRK